MHLQVAHGPASCLTCYPHNLHGTSTEKIPWSSLLWEAGVLTVIFCFQHLTLQACHPRNLCGISTVASASCLLSEAGLFLILPPTHFMRQVKRCLQVNIQYIYITIIYIYIYILPLIDLVGRVFTNLPPFP